MNDFTNVFQNQKSAATTLIAVAVMLAGSALAADPATSDAEVIADAVSARPVVTATSVSVKTVTTTVTHGDAADEKRIATLHDNLKITPPQEALWSTVADTMRANDDRIDALSTARHDHAATMTAVADLASYAEMSQAHAESVKALHASFLPLYEAMSVSQKANADQVFRQSGMKGHKKAL